MTFRLRYAAISDVGRVRKDNQDSGYVGPWMLAVCDGVGGAARGDLASATAIGQLRKLDARPSSSASDDMKSQVAGALHRANDRIAELVDDDPTLSGTSTTATMALFDGEKLTFGHVGDSRAYLFRDGEIRQVTKDHTFVQSLIDEGRITEEESRTHPHRNLILKAIDGVHDIDADLFDLEIQHGRPAAVLQRRRERRARRRPAGRRAVDGHPRLRRRRAGARQPRGRHDRQRHLRGGRRRRRGRAPRRPAADAGRCGRRPQATARTCRRCRTCSAGTGPATPASSSPSGPRSPTCPFAIETDPVDPEEARYAPRPPRRFLVARRVLAGVAVVGVAWIAGAAAYSWSQQQFYVGDHDGTVTIFRGVDADIPGVSLSQPYETTNVTPGPALRLRRLDRARGHRRRQPRRRPGGRPPPGRQPDHRRRRRQATDDRGQRDPERHGHPQPHRLRERHAMSQSGMIMEFVHRRRRGAELFLLVLALAVGVGAYAAVGLGVEGEVPTDLLTYGGWLAGLVVVAHVVVRFVAPYADPVLLPVVAALNGLGLAIIHRLDLSLDTTLRPPAADLDDPRRAAVRGHPAGPPRPPGAAAVHLHQRARGDRAAAAARWSPGSARRSTAPGSGSTSARSASSPARSPSCCWWSPSPATSCCTATRWPWRVAGCCSSTCPAAATSARSC